jgi:hypothetical protein
MTDPFSSIEIGGVSGRFVVLIIVRPRQDRV